MYRTIESGIWDDPKFEPLPQDAKLLFVYLFTNRHAHVSGVYPMKRAMAALEIVMPEEALRPALDRLEADGLIVTDRARNIVWVVNMLRHQGRGEKNERSAARQLETLHGSPLIADYLKRYPEVRQFLRTDRVSIGYSARPDTLSGVGSQNPEQEQETEKEPEAGAGGALGSALADPTPAARPLMTFPCLKGQKHGPETWVLTAELVAEWEAAYPDMDILREAAKALAWVKSHSLKTHAGMPPFLVGWFNRGQNGNRYERRVAAAPKQAQTLADREAYLALLEEQRSGGVAEDDAATLEAIKSHLRRSLDPDEFHTWVLPLLVIDKTEDKIRVAAPNRRFVNTLRESYGTHLSGAAQACGLTSIEVQIAPAAHAAGGTL